MRRSASEVIRNLEMRIARLEKQSVNVMEKDWGPAELCYTGKSNFHPSGKCLQPQFGFKSMRAVRDSKGEFDWKDTATLTVSDLSVASQKVLESETGRALVFRTWSENFKVRGGLNDMIELQERKLGVSVRSAKVVDVRVPKNSYVDYTPHASHMRDGFLIEGEMTLELAIMGSRQKEKMNIRFKAFGEAVLRGSNFTWAWQQLQGR